MLSKEEGSPPPTRGTLEEFGGLLTSIRDHPRLRGEHLILSQVSETKPGSPPPTRGTLSCILVRVGFRGITPAYAGNTRLL